MPVAGQVLRDKSRQFTERFRAWWNGYDMPVPTGAMPDTPSLTDENGADEARPEATWPAERLALVEMLWGQGCLSPDGAAYCVDIVRPAAINESHSLLHIGAGLGGASRALAEAFGVYVTGIDCDRDLAAEGMRRSKTAGFEVRAAIDHQDFEAPSFKQKGFDCVLIQNALVAAADKSRLLGAAVAALKPNGQLICTELVTTDDDPSDAVTEWAADEPGISGPWRMDALASVLTEGGLTLRAAVDETDRYKSMALAGWDVLVRANAKSKLSAAHLMHLEREAERWARRMALIDDGELKFYRVQAVEKSD